ncbi:hypothetical protein NE237_018768 [Protea cynaroides]|uniref:Uncharacterized protein n=1 Tax=Protea cynaroides TaxID=273540 RepID=A0A9Q0KAK6_9MAGN|nr:hypothetical protein NE237_018768 [Protea cynaroides]
MHGDRQIRLENQTLSGNWDAYRLEGGEDGEADSSDIKRKLPHAQRGLLLENWFGEFKTVTTCNKCKPAVISSETDNGTKNSNTVVPSTYSHLSAQPQSEHRRPIFSWFFPRLKKKHKNETSPDRAESEEVSQIFNDFGIMSTESLKKELIEATENRDVALMEILKGGFKICNIQNRNNIFLRRAETEAGELKILKFQKGFVEGREID